MKPIRNIKDLIGKDVAVYCENREQAQKFVESCFDNNFKWRAYTRNDEINSMYESNYVYFMTDNSLTRGTIGWCLEHKKIDIIHCNNIVGLKE